MMCRRFRSAALALAVLLQAPLALAQPVLPAPPSPSVPSPPPKAAAWLCSQAISACTASASSFWRDQNFWSETMCVSLSMNLLMMFNGVNEEELMKNAEKEGGITNYDILSQIMPPLSIKNKIEIR